MAINGGIFGQNFIDLCRIHNLNYDEIKPGTGKCLKREELYRYDNCGYTTLLAKLHETSSGFLYNINMSYEFDNTALIDVFNDM